VLDFAGTAPREVVLVGVVPETLEGGMALSARVAGAVAGAGEVVLALIASLNVSLTAEHVLIQDPDRTAFSSAFGQQAVAWPRSRWLYRQRRRTHRSKGLRNNRSSIAVSSRALRVLR
jgi:hypothetical protein